MDKLGGHYAKRNKVDQKRHILLYVEYKKKIKQTSGHSKEEADSENKLMVNSGEREVVKEKIGVEYWDIQRTML